MPPEKMIGPYLRLQAQTLRGFLDSLKGPRQCTLPGALLGSFPVARCNKLLLLPLRVAAFFAGKEQERAENEEQEAETAAE